MVRPITKAPRVLMTKVIGGGGVGPAKKSTADASIGVEKKVRGRSPPHSSSACSTHTVAVSDPAATPASASLTVVSCDKERRSSK
jgi:hypothetical protein